MTDKFLIPVIGIETHIELKTTSKMFCGCPANHFQIKPNTHTCPVCLGLPGSLPVPNKCAIDWCIMIGLALNCKVASQSKFDRKNYFYPDLPKGYQISQYDQPFCTNGQIIVNDKKININRVHMEEDTGKLIHKDSYTLVDLNRSGVPLVEIVSQPEIEDANQAVNYLKKIQQIIRYLGVSDCDMEKGSMRCEINISLTQTKNSLPKYRVEIKNINSFRFVKKAIEYEIQRQKKLLKKRKLPAQETRGFNEKKQITFPQRTKEEAHDYRYFPEPDIPPIKLEKKQIGKILDSLPELPDEKAKRFKKDYSLNDYNAKLLTQTKKLADYFDQTAKIAKSKDKINQLANLIINKKVNITKLTPPNLVKHLARQKAGKVTDKDQLTKIAEQVLKENKKAVEDYKKGKINVIRFLVGKVMSQTKGKAEAKIVQKILVEKIAQPQADKTP